MSNTYKINLREIQTKINQENALFIFQDLLGEIPRNNRLVRLFDDTKNSAEVFRDNHQKYGTHIHNYATGEHYTAVNAYMKAHGLEWKDAVIELGKQYNHLPYDYDKVPYQKRLYTPRPQPTEKERKEASCLANPIFDAWSEAHLAFWQKWNITQALLEQYGIKPLKSFDLLNVETEEHKCTIKPEFAYAYQIGKAYKLYQTKPQKTEHKWSWAGNLTKSNILWGIEQLPEKCTKIAIVEGLKDALCIVANFSEFGIYAVGLDSAGQELNPKDLEFLKSKVSNPNDLFLCLDNDDTGKKQNEAKAQKYGLSYLPYPEKFASAKDTALLIERFEKFAIKEWLTSHECATALIKADKNTQEGLLQEPKPQDIPAKQRFIRAGDTYYEIIYRPNTHGIIEKEIVQRQKGTIIDDYGRKALDEIEKYYDFCLVPSHTNFRQVIANCYNRYNELKYKPLKGDCTNSLNMVKHIFGEKYYELGLDYLQLLYTQPTLRLPILGLVSKERNTGKSTFADWLIEIFTYDNCAKLGNSDLGGDFNDFYAQKLLIIVDESAIDKQAISEAVKRMSTETGKIMVNAKSKAHTPKDFIGKFIFISNNEDNFINIGKGETRYLILKINPLEADTPNMAEMLKKEIPAFLHYLTQRKLAHEGVGRMYFDSALLQNEYLDRIIEANKNPIERAITDLIRTTFECYDTEIYLNFGVTDLYNELKETISWVNKQKIMETIKRDMSAVIKKTDKQGRYEFQSMIDFEVWGIPDTFPPPRQRNGVHYVAKVQDFLGNAEYEARLGKIAEKI